MTWLKLSDDFGDECAKVDLSDAAFRTHVEALLWTMRRESAGRLTFRDVRRFAESEQVAEAIAELLKVGFWAETRDGYVIEHHMEHQPEPEIIEQRRRMDAERQRRVRFRKAKIASTAVDVSRRDNTRDPGRGGSGRDRKTPDYVAPKKGDTENADENTEDWPDVAKPGSWADELYDRE